MLTRIYHLSQMVRHMIQLDNFIKAYNGVLVLFFQIERLLLIDKGEKYPVSKSMKNVRSKIKI